MHQHLKIPFFLFLLITLLSTSFHTVAQPKNKRPVFAIETLTVQRSVKAIYEDMLLAMPNVQGVGIAERDGKAVILVLVNKLEKASRIPKSLDDVSVVVEQIGPGTYLNGGAACASYPGGCHSQEYPFPVPMGVSTSSEAHYNAGTLGFKACEPVTKTLGYVSANHVAAGVPTPGNAFCYNGAPGLRQAHQGLFELDSSCASNPSCAGNPTVFSNEVGILNKVINIVPPPGRNRIDAAFVSSNDDLTSASIVDIGVPASAPGQAVLNSCVRKSGRTTGLTHGRIDVLDLTWTNRFDDCLVEDPVFDDLISVRPDNNCGLCDGQACGEFAIGGDSGSALVDTSNRVIGLVFARESGSNGMVFAGTAQNVLSELGVTLDLNQCASLPQEVAFPVLADAYIIPEWPNNNYGSSSRVFMRTGKTTGYIRKAFFRFRVSGVTGTVTSAKLRVKTGPIEFPSTTISHMSNARWGEFTINWNNAPTNSFITFPGGALKANTWEEIDVTNIINGNGAYTIGMLAPDIPNLYVRSRQTDEKPTLIVTYQP